MWNPFRRKPRRVRIQYLDDKGAVDGILVGYHAGHYVMRSAYFYRQRPGAEGEGVELLGETWIPRERVFMVTNVRI